MYKKILSAYLVFSPLCSTFLISAPPSTEVYDEKKVARIDIVAENLPPNASFDPKAVYARLKTKVGDPFSQFIFDSDLKTLAEEYDQVEPQMEVTNGELYITLKIWVKPMIRSIKWEGNQNFKTSTLQKELAIKPNSTFNRAAFNKAFNKVKELYIKKGYFEAELQYTLVPDNKTNEVDILIHVSEGRSGRIGDIIFTGFSKDDESAILDMIYTKKYNLFFSWFTGHGIYQEEALEQDKLTIINYLQNEGYADAKVDIQITENPAKTKIILEIHADKGPIYHFGEITFEGNVLFTDEQIEKRFLVHPEDTYSPELLRETIQSIKELYGRKGYIDANVQYEAHLVENAPVYDVVYRIDEGQQYKIGLVHVFGNVQTQTRVILRESLLTPGETFDSARLKATQMRLENTGYFKTVNVYAVRTQEDQALGDAYRDVYIEVEETTTGNLSLFFGFSSADSAFGGLDLVESNFNFRGIPKVTSKGPRALRGGGEYLHARFSIGAKVTTYSLSWLEPYFRDTLWRLGFEGSKSISTLQSKHYNIHNLNFTAYTSYPVMPFTAFGMKYRVRDSQIHISGDASRKEKKDAGSEGVISAIGTSLTYDSTNSIRKPTRGFRSYLGVEYAGVGGDFYFLHFDFVNSLYTQLWRHGIMKYRFELRFIDPIWKTSDPNDIPISERFFLGGENSVRGYKPFDLGPHFKHGDPQGGISASLVSIEYLQEIIKICDAFVFADAGMVSMGRFAIDKFNCSYGGGLRLDVINNVPVIIGMGFPINPTHKSQVRRFYFQMGGQF